MAEQSPLEVRFRAYLQEYAEKVSRLSWRDQSPEALATRERWTVLMMIACDNPNWPLVPPGWAGSPGECMHGVAYEDGCNACQD
jgi:hypothetical protein